jgi:endogenous inhibitor of DNA gyrase (YacG/DUF329 family)
MPRKRAVSLRCPTCRKIVLRSEPEFPFCSQRCRVIDLGKWATGAYVISTPVTDPEQFESQRERSESRDDEDGAHRGRR